MHHAYLIPKKIEGESLKDFILSFLDLTKEETEFHFFEDNNFKIDLAREVKDSLQTKSPVGINRLICLSFVTMNDSAQNTLLKMVEEPGENTVFFFITSHPDKLLPTIHSRVEKVHVGAVANEKKVMKSQSLTELMKQATKIVDDIKNEKANKEHALEFMDSLLELARKNKKSPVTLERLLKLRSYILDQSSSIKQILESAILLSYGI